MKRRIEMCPDYNLGQGVDICWSLVREMGVDYLPSIQVDYDSPLHFYAFAVHGPYDTYRAVHVLSVGKYLTLTTHCKTYRVDRESNGFHEFLGVACLKA